MQTCNIDLLCAVTTTAAAGGKGHTNNHAKSGQERKENLFHTL